MIDEIEVNEEYKINGYIEEVLFIGNSAVFSRDKKGRESCHRIKYFKENAIPHIPEREKIELFLCVDNLWRYRWLDKDFRRPYRCALSWSSPLGYAQRVYPPQSMFIYADDFTIVKGE